MLTAIGVYRKPSITSLKAYHLMYTKRLSLVLLSIFKTAVLILIFGFGLSFIGKQIWLYNQKSLARQIMGTAVNYRNKIKRERYILDHPDPWGNHLISSQDIYFDYRYVLMDITVISYGPDKVFGTKDDIEITATHILLGS